MAKSANHTPSDPGSPATGKIDIDVLRTRKPQMFSTSVAVIARAREELEGLSGYKVDSVTGFEKTDAGWRLTIAVVELRRIPAASDVLGSYEVNLNQAGDVINYHRDNRYFRNQVGQEE